MNDRLPLAETVVDYLPHRGAPPDSVCCYA